MKFFVNLIPNRLLCVEFPAYYAFYAKYRTCALNLCSYIAPLLDTFFGVFSRKIEHSEPQRIALCIFKKQNVEQKISMRRLAVFFPLAK